MSGIKSEGEAKPKSKAKLKRKTEYNRSTKKTPKSVKGEESPLQASPPMFMLSEPSGEEELPLPQEIAEAAANEASITGAGEMEEGEDFILEPPVKFSQSSIDDIEDFDIDDDNGPLSFDFAPPAAPSEDELEEQPHPPSYQHTHTHKAPQLKTPSINKASKNSDNTKKGQPREKITGAARITRETEEFPAMEDEWQGLDYPVSSSARQWSRSSQEIPGQPNPMISRGQANEFDEFVHRSALEEVDDDDERGVVLDDDVAALIW